MNFKICNKCKKTKNLLEFYKDKSRLDGFSKQCKICRKKSVKIYRMNNPDKIKEINRKWRCKNLEKMREYLRKWNKDHPNRYTETRKRWKKNHPEKVREYARSSYYKHKDKYLKMGKEWRDNNKEYLKNYYKIYNKKCYKKLKEDKEKYKKKLEYNRNWNKNHLDVVHRSRKNWEVKNREIINYKHKERRRKDIGYRLRKNVSRYINGQLKRRLLNKNCKSTFSFLPYTVDELKKHLENQFEPWMNWNNYGAKQGLWTIDHIKPNSSFNYKSVDDEEFQKCWSLENLRPLEWLENIRKSNKII